MTSLFSRLQKLNKESTPGPWTQDGGTWFTPEGYARWTGNWIRNAALIVECRNSLPAVLDCIAALVRCCEETDYCYVCDNHPSHGHAKDCSLAVFVSGQEAT